MSVVNSENMDNTYIVSLFLPSTCSKTAHVEPIFASTCVMLDVDRVYWGQNLRK